VSKLDEQALRRPEFSAGVPIRLADGQTWHFPKPTIDLFPVVDRAGQVAVGGAASFGPEYDDLVEAFYRARSHSPADQLQALFALGVDLLGRNYLLAPEHFRGVLRFQAGHEAHETMWQEILDVALGASPKASPVGAGPSSSPTGSAAA
jgi:hypothetical protein